MKVLIQQNWTSGLGDLYCGASEYLNFIKPLKELGYETELIFSFNGVSGGNKFIGLTSFDDIFDSDTFKLFDNIRVREYPIGDKEYQGLKYHHTQYGPSSPGAHWWDCFFDKIPENIQYPNFNPTTLLSSTQIPEVLPKFNREVYRRANNFLNKINTEYDFIHIRYYEYQFKTNEIVLSAENLYDKIKDSEKIFHVGSNNQYTIDKLSKLPNVHTYEFKNLDLFSNDHMYYFYNKHISNEMLLDRLYDNLAEMVSLTNPRKIHQLTYFSWISNFVYYGLANREVRNVFNNLDKNNIIF